MHTPTPWRLSYNFPTLIEVSDTPRLIVIAKTTRDVSVEEEKENAAFIVTACNAHDALVAALTEAIGLIRIWHGIQNGEEAWNIYAAHSPEMKRLNAALALVTPQEAVR